MTDKAASTKKKALKLLAVSISAAIVFGGLTGSAQAVDSGVALTGAGSTFVLNIMTQWASDAKKSSAMGFTVNYSGTGSGAGRNAFIQNTVDFAGSDVAFKAEEKPPPFVYVLDICGGISIMFNVPGVTNLRLTAPTVAKIFKGSITNWNDAAITADNGTALPDKPIQPFVRSDSSGTTDVFTSYLHAASPGDWPASGSGTFPVEPGKQQTAKGSDGVADAVKSHDGGVGYAELSFAVERGLPSVRVKNSGGSFVAPEPSNVTAAIDDATLNSDGTVTLNFTTKSPAAYPISTVSYVIAPTSGDSKKADNLKAFLTYATGATGQSRAQPLNYAPLPERLLEADKVQIAKINPASPAAAQQPVSPGRVGDPAPAVAAAAVGPAPATTSPAEVAGTTVSKTNASVDSTGGAIHPANTGGADVLVGAGGLSLLLAGLLLRRRPASASK